MKPEDPSSSAVETFFDYPADVASATGIVADSYEWFYGIASNRRRSKMMSKALLSFFEGVLERIFYPLASDHAFGDHIGIKAYVRSEDAKPFHGRTSLTGYADDRFEIGSKHARFADHATFFDILIETWSMFFDDSSSIVPAEESGRPNVNLISWSLEKFQAQSGSAIDPEDGDYPIGYPFDTCRMTWDLGLWSKDAIVWNLDDYIVYSSIKRLMEDIGLVGDYYSVGVSDFGDLARSNVKPLLDEIDSNSEKNWYSPCPQVSLAGGPDELTTRSHIVPLMCMQLMVASMRYLNFTTTLSMAWRLKRTRQRAYYVLSLGTDANMIAGGGVEDPVEDEMIGPLEGYRRMGFEGFGFSAVFKIVVPTSCSAEDPTPLLWRSGAQIAAMEDIGGGISRWHIGKVVLGAQEGEPEIIDIFGAHLQCDIETLTPIGVHDQSCKGAEGWPSRTMYEQGRVSDVTMTAFDGFVCPDDDMKLGNISSHDCSVGNWDDAAKSNALSLLNSFPGRYSHEAPPGLLNYRLLEESNRIWADVYVDYNRWDGKQCYKEGSTTPYYVPANVYGAPGETDPVHGEKIEYRMQVNFSGFPVEDLFGQFDVGPYWRHVHAGCVGTCEFAFKNFVIDYGR